jgi:hypothetical protein
MQGDVPQLCDVSKPATKGNASRNLKTLGLIGVELQDMPRQGLQHSTHHRKHTTVPTAFLCRVIAIHGWSYKLTFCAASPALSTIPLNKILEFI